MKCFFNSRQCYFVVFAVSTLVLISITTQCFPQQEYSNVQHLNIKDGLVHNRIKRIIKDRNGFFWVGTDMGLCRYDGYKFDEIGASIDDGSSLSNSMISGLYEDIYGYIWIGTDKNVLYRYNPEKEVFISMDTLLAEVPGFQELSINYITGQGGKVYLATSKGVFEFLINPSEDDGNLQVSLSKRLLESYNVTTLLIDHLGLMWLGTMKNGLFLIDERIDKKEAFNSTNWPKNGISHNHISCLLESANGNLIIGTWGGGLNILYRGSGRIKTFNTDIEKGLNSNFIYDLEYDHSGSIWMGTYVGSLYEVLNFDDPTGKVIFREVVFESQNVEIEIDESSKVLCEDETGFLWIGTLGNGIKKYYSSINNIHLIIKNESEPNSLNNNDVTVIFEDHLDGIWVGTWGGGVNYTTSTHNAQIRNEFKHYTHDPENSKSISGNLIQCIYEDKQNNLWIGTYQAGLNRLLPDKQTFEHFSCHVEEDGSEDGVSIMSFFETSGGEKLIGTDRGLMKLVLDNNGLRNNCKFMPFISELEGGLKSEQTTVLCFAEFPEEVLWLGTLNNGLIKIIKDSSDFGWKYDRSYKSGGLEGHSVSNNSIRSLLADGEGNIWIGTHIGLNKFTPATGIFRKFGVEDGLSNRNIGKLVSDQEGNIWIGTELGINRLNLKTSEIKSYIIPGEASKNDFNWGAGHRCKNGMICFGSNRGLISFMPSNLTENTVEPPVVITDFQIANKSIGLSEKEAARLHLPKSINYLDKIRLPHQWNTFSIEFSGLSHFLPEQNSYRFMLEGYHNSWIYTDYNSHVARFYNIPSGHFTFKVNAANNDGYWNYTGRELQIRILPPFWRSWWAYLIYSILIILTFYYTRKITSARVKMKYELELEKMKREKGEEVNQLKLKFFTSISHEFRTPLTLIIAPLERLIESSKNNISLSQQLFMINKNAKRLLYLVNELMDFRKIETGKLAFNPAAGNFHDVIKEVYSFFENYAADHHIDYVCSQPDKKLLVWFDYEKFEKILFNLLSNAFKYTQDYGVISIIVHDDPVNPDDENEFDNSYCIGNLPVDYLEISIRDSGMGIAADKLQVIFDRFYQIQDETSHHKQGTGIGLSLVKEFVLIHKGQICVSSTIGKGSLFQVRIPKGSDNFNDNISAKSNSDGWADEKLLGSIFTDPEFDSLIELDAGNEKEAQYAPLKQNKSSSLILIVEDNVELRKVLKDHFSENHRIIEAGDGEKALKMTVQFFPDIVICDVMMPIMDGMQFCKELRENIQISHTPVILLTADTDPNHRIEGIETGADSYILKPFSFRFLDATVNNLLESRAKLRQLFSKTINVQPGEVTVTSRDEKILSKAIAFVEKNLSNEDLEVEDLCNTLGFSRSQLYRKLKNLTSLGPNEFIRSIRLKVAAQLLIKEKTTVSEILYKVGFNNRSYFARCFKKEFGLSPKEYQEKFEDN